MEFTLSEDSSKIDYLGTRIALNHFKMDQLRLCLKARFLNLCRYLEVDFEWRLQAEYACDTCDYALIRNILNIQAYFCHKFINW